MKWSLDSAFADEGVIPLKVIEVLGKDFMMLKKGEQNETVSIHRQPDLGDIEASRSRIADNEFMPRVRH